MAGKTSGGLMQQQPQQADPSGGAMQQEPLTQSDLYNLQSQNQGKSAAPVFSGGGDDSSSRIAAIRQMLQGSGPRQMKPLKQTAER